MPITACDDTVVFKSVVREIARNHGLRATFMAKPFPGVSGNGLHLHHSLRKDGVNVFEHGTDEHALGNASMRHWVAGLTTHTAQIALLANPTVNAYKRIEDYSFAPTRVSWGLDNRNVAVRCIPQVGLGLARRVPRRLRRRQPLPADRRRAGRRHGRDRARARAAADGRARRLRRRAPAAPAAHAGCRDRGLGGDAVRARDVRRARSRTTTRRSRATTWRSTRPSSPTGKRSATGSSHSLGATRELKD